MFCDLHTHTVHSDGTLTPTQLVEEAVRRNLSAIALTDHNTFDGLPEFLAAADKAGIDAAPGIEIPASFDGEEYHIIALFVRSGQYSRFRDILDAEIRNSDECKRSLVERLRQRGYDIDYDLMLEKNGKTTLNRLHIAAELTERGYTPSIREAFDSLLSKKAGIYIEPEHIGVTELIRVIRETGAVAILAHPLFRKSVESIERLLREAVPAGLDAMEVYYSEYSEETTRQALSIAEHYGISFSGGSDFHGSNKPHIQLGIGTGHLAVPHEWFEHLKQIHLSRTEKR